MSLEPARASSPPSRDARASCSRGADCERRGRLEDAAAAYARAVALDPGCTVAHFNLGNVLRQLRRRPEAIASYGRALKLRPDWTDAYCNLALTLQEVGRMGDSLTVLRRLAGLKPQDPDAHFALGNTLRDAGRTSEAVEAFQRTLALRPTDAPALLNLGQAQATLGQPDAALATYRRAVAVRPDYPEAWLNLGNTLRRLGQTADALPCYERALTARPGYVEACSNLGAALRELNRVPEALAAYERALALDPGYVEAAWNRALAQLALGDYAAGWRGYELRWRRPNAVRLPSHGLPVWLGETPIRGRRLLLQHEQGLGDSIQMVRYVRLLQAAGATCLVHVPAPLVALVARSFPAAVVSSDPPPAGTADARIPLLSLPLALGSTSEAAIPRWPAYLTPDPAQVARWADGWRGPPARRLGLIWRGNPHHDNDHQRSLPLSALRPLLDARPDWEFAALQKGLTPAERTLLAACPNVRVFDAELTDFDATAAIMANLGGVVSVDSSPAHLAGALGVPTTLLLCHGGEWRWGIGRSDTPWYPAMRLARQAASGDWAGVVAGLAAPVREP
jgi:tetratricopeptide (TPR) repeat protein